MQIICTGRTNAIEGKMRYFAIYHKCGCWAHDCTVQLDEYVAPDGTSWLKITHGTDVQTWENTPGIDKLYILWASRLHGITPAQDGHPVPKIPVHVV